MSWKDRPNRALDRALGLQVVKTSSLNRMRADAQRTGPLRNRLRRVQEELAQATQPAERKKARRYPPDMERNFCEIWDLVRERTMTAHDKGYFLYQAVHYIVRHQVPGAIVECGVWRGGSMLSVAHTLNRLSVSDRDLYLFDTYTGMSEPTERDVHMGRSALASDLMKTYSTDSNLWAIASLEDVAEGFASVDYPAERVHFVEGKVEDTIPEKAPEQIAVLRLDTDWYESTKHELAHLYSRLQPGGVLIVDDYGTWKGSKDATDEFLADTGEPLLLVRTGFGRAAVKPGLPSRAVDDH